jgi:hypothetical protein
MNTTVSDTKLIAIDKPLPGFRENEPDRCG